MQRLPVPWDAQDVYKRQAYERYFDFEDIYTEGITKITPEDMEYAAKLGRTIRCV